MDLPLAEFQIFGLNRTAIGTILFLAWEVLAVLSIIAVVMRAKTAAGAWGWAMAMIAVPFVAVPLYWILGRQQFNGYVDKFRRAKSDYEAIFDDMADTLAPFDADLDAEDRHYGDVLERLSERMWTVRNEVCLLINGEEIFDSIIEEIEKARDYVLMQFFIVKDDKIGRKIRELLERKAREGVRIYLVYDEIGSHKLPRSYVRSLRDAGVDVHAFHSTQGPSNRFQINFRNHRKIVVIDGEVGFVGGANIGDEYVETTERFGEWRDTQVRIVGPAVLSMQMVFLADFFWAAGRIPDVDWKHVSEAQADSCGIADARVLILPTGPIEMIEGGTVFFLNAITRARHRCWIATPYFVTDESIRSALQMAALQGVDVRLMIPDKPDKWIPWLATFSYLPEMEAAGVRIFRYEPGFIHQKVVLVDDRFSAVGTANLDNRSMRLNFEVTATVLCRRFAGRVEEMLLTDFERCREIFGRDYTSRPIWFRLGVKLARLASPVL